MHSGMSIGNWRRSLKSSCCRPCQPLPCHIQKPYRVASIAFSCRMFLLNISDDTLNLSAVVLCSKSCLSCCLFLGDKSFILHCTRILRAYFLHSHRALAAKQSSNLVHTFKLPTSLPNTPSTSLSLILFSLGSCKI